MDILVSRTLYMSCQAGPGIEPGPSALKASALPIELTWQTTRCSSVCLCLLFWSVWMCCLEEVCRCLFAIVICLVLLMCTLTI